MRNPCSGVLKSMEEAREMRVKTIMLPDLSQYCVSGSRLRNPYDGPDGQGRWTVVGREGKKSVNLQGFFPSRSHAIKAALSRYPRMTVSSSKLAQDGRLAEALRKGKEMRAFKKNRETGSW